MRFRVTALSPANEIRVLAVDAASDDEARRQAGALGLTVLTVRDDSVSPAPGGGLAVRQGRFSLLLFSQHLVSLLESGLTVVDALEALAEDESGPATEPVARQVLAGVRSGLALSAAMAALPAIFPDHYLAIVRASEQSGGVAEALGRWASYQSVVEATRQKALQALIYPAILVIAGGLVCLFLLAYVVPRFAAVYEGRLDDLPLLSQWLIGWGKAFAAHGETLLLLVVGGLLGVLWAFTRPPVVARLWALAWRLPALGRSLRLYQLARLYRTISMLLRGGMPVAAALELAPGLVAPALRGQVSDAAQAIRAGHSILDAFRRAGLATPVAERMLRVGERAGNIDAMMDRIATYYDDETTRALTAFGKVFEPAVMALIGFLVGGIVILMYIPIFEIAGRLQS